MKRLIASFYLLRFLLIYMMLLFCMLFVGYSDIPRKIVVVSFLIGVVGIITACVYIFGNYNRFLKISGLVLFTSFLIITCVFFVLQRYLNPRLLLDFGELCIAIALFDFFSFSYLYIDPKENFPIKENNDSTSHVEYIDNDK